MFHSVKYLNFKRNEEKQPIQICWCAATKKNFIGKDAYEVSKHELNSINIADICNTIITELFESENGGRLTLYLAAQLTYGTLRIFMQQIILLEENCEKLITNVKVAFIRSKEEKPKSKSLVETNLSYIQENLEILSLGNLSVVNPATIFPNAFPADTNVIEELNFTSTFKDYELSFDAENYNDESVSQILTEFYQDLNRPDIYNDMQSDDINRTKYVAPIAPQINIISHISEEPKENTQQRQVEYNDFKEIHQNFLKVATKRKLPNNYDRKMELMSSLSESTEIARTSLQRWDNLLVAQSLSPAFKAQLNPNNEDAAIATSIEAALPTDLPFDSITITSEFGAMLHSTKYAEPELPEVKRSKFIFKDKVKQCKLIDHQKVTSYTCRLTKEIIQKHYEKQLKDTLLTLPSTLKRKYEYGRLWSFELLEMFAKKIRFLQENSVNRSKETVTIQPNTGVNIVKDIDYKLLHNITKDVHIVLNRIDEEKIDEITSMMDNMTNFNTQKEPENIDNNLQLFGLEEINFDIEQNSLTMKQWDTETDLSIHKQKHKLTTTDEQIELPDLKKLKTSSRTSEVNFELGEGHESEDYLTKLNFLDLVEIFWTKVEKYRKKGYKDIKVEFEKIVNPAVNSRNEAIKYLMHCLYLELEGKLYLKQKEPYTPLYVLKPE